MGRPRSNSAEPSARERIIGAFWGLLSEMSYEDITVSALIRRASVSPNTLYYHFSGYDEVVRSALDETLEPRILGLILNTSSGSEAALPSDIQERFGRIALFASDGSGKLPAILGSALKRAWLAEMGLDQDDLSAIEEYEIDFIFAGVVRLLEALSHEPEALDRGLLQEFFQRPLGSGILRTIEALSNGRP